MKAKIALFLTFVFIGIISYPTIVSFSEEKQEISSLFDNSNEEEKKSEKSEKKIELELKKTDSFKGINNSSLRNSKHNAIVKNYFLELSKINTPPPELYI